jgi:hypothetical protein
MPDREPQARLFPDEKPRDDVIVINGRSVLRVDGDQRVVLAGGLPVQDLGITVEVKAAACPPQLSVRFLSRRVLFRPGFRLLIPCLLDVPIALDRTHIVGMSWRSAAQHGVGSAELLRSRVGSAR